MSYCKFCDVLKQLRTERGITQQELGKNIGISKAVVSKYENNIGYPTLDTLIRIAEYFGVTNDYLLGVERSKVIDVTDLTNEEIESIHSIYKGIQKIQIKRDHVHAQDRKKRTIEKKSLLW